MSLFPHRSATRHRLRLAWMFALYTAFVTSVALSADRAALLAQVQALTDGGQPVIAPSRTDAAVASPVTRHANAR